jgi:hypothetical protein
MHTYMCMYNHMCYVTHTHTHTHTHIYWISHFFSRNAQSILESLLKSRGNCKWCINGGHIESPVWDSSRLSRDYVAQLTMVVPVCATVWTDYLPHRRLLKTPLSYFIHFIDPYYLTNAKMLVPVWDWAIGKVTSEILLYQWKIHWNS